MRSDRRAARVVVAVAAAGLCAATLVVGSPPSSAGTTPRVTSATCAARPWMSATYQAHATVSALATMVLACLKLRFPTTATADEIGIVALNQVGWFQNVNEYGNGSVVQQQLASLGMPPVSFEDGPGGLITGSTPNPTALPDDLALGATFDPQLASLYGTVLGAQAHAMGYDGVQAPDLNLLRVPTWGRAFESFGESPVLAGILGAAEAVAIENQGTIPVLKHFGPYSQDTDRHQINQLVSTKALDELYIRPFTFALRALRPIVAHRGHAVGVMCSYGDVNDLRACRSSLLQEELDYVGVSALVRTDLNVEVDPGALLLSNVDLIKPLDTEVLDQRLADPAVGRALDQSVLRIFAIEFADGLVDGVTVARPHGLPASLAASGLADAQSIEEHAIVLLKDAGGILPITAADKKVVLLTDGTFRGTCGALAITLVHALGVHATCVDLASVARPRVGLFTHQLFRSASYTTRTTTFDAPYSGPYSLSVDTFGDTQVDVDGRPVFVTHGLAEYNVPRSADVTLAAGVHSITVGWLGTPPSVSVVQVLGEARAAANAARGANVALFLAYDLSHEGMDRDSLELPNGQDAVISAVGAVAPTVVGLVTDGAVTMPWLGRVRGVVEFWNPTGSVSQDLVASKYMPAWAAVLDGAANPSGRLPVTFPVTMQHSPAGVEAFWPGGADVDLELPPDQGVGIGMAWYRTAHWPVLYPFGYGLSYSRYAIVGGSVQMGPGGLGMVAEVTDHGSVGGQVPVEVYADFPKATGEPALELVGVGVATFTAAQARSGATEFVHIGLSPDAFTVESSGSLRLAGGAYCLEAASYDGDPGAWGTGSVAMTPNASDSLLRIRTQTQLSPKPCPQ